MRRVEVVDVTPVRARIGLLRVPLQYLVDQLELAETRLADQEKIETLLIDIDPELDRLQRALLAEWSVERLEPVRGFEVELLQIAALVKRLGRQGFDFLGHGRNLSQSLPRDTDMDQFPARFSSPPLPYRAGSGATAALFSDVADG